MQVVMGLRPNVNSTGNDGNTPAHFAAMEGHLECLKVLVYHKNKPLEVVSKRNNDVSGIAQKMHIYVSIPIHTFFRGQLQKTWPLSFRSKTVLTF